MSFIAKDTGGGGNFKPVPMGMHHAICYALVDLGTQVNEIYGNEQHKGWIAWELPEERIEIEGESRPRVISKFYTISLHEKSNLRQHLESWRGRVFTPEELKGFDLSKILGTNCQINVIHKKNKKNEMKAEISAITPMGKGSVKREAENDLIYYSISEHGPDIPDNIPDGIKAIITKAFEFNMQGQQEYASNIPESPPIDSYEDDIPF